MTIEQVDAMTRYADGTHDNPNVRTPQRKGFNGVYTKPTQASTKVWISKHSVARNYPIDIQKMQRSIQ
jgi:hypothetical protein